MFDCGIFSLITAAIAVGDAHFGPGSGQIWLNNVNCAGREAELSECRHPGFGVLSCSHNNDAGVQCQAGITVVVYCVLCLLLWHTLKLIALNYNFL